MSDTKEKVSIDKMCDFTCAKLAVENHIIGGLRNDGDLANAKFHATCSVDLMIDFIENIVGTDEQKLELLKKVKANIDKFTVKNENDE